MTKAEFFGWSIPQLIDSGINLKLVNKIGIKGYSGWFNAGKKELTVCTKSKEYFEIYLHEFCHYLQWKENSQQWQSFTKGVNNFFTWLDGTRVKQRNRKVVQSMELDCEKRVLKLIKKLNLPIDKAKYCQKANACLFSYLLTEKLRMWETKENSSVYSAEIAKYFPARLLSIEDYCKISNMPKEARALMEKTYRQL